MLTNAHGRRWWRLRKDINHLQWLIKSSAPTEQDAIERKKLVVAQLQEVLDALPLRARPRDLMDIRGRS